MVHFAPCWNDTGAQEFALIFTRDIFAKHGIPQEVVTDRGTQFTSHFWSSVAKMLGVKQCLSSARQPQTDGQTERTKCSLEDMSRHFVYSSHYDWDLRLPSCEFAINNAWNQSTGSTPFFLNTGSHPRSPVNVEVVCKLPAAHTFVGRIQESIARARDCLKYAQARMKESYDAKHRAESFEVGEFVFLSPRGLLLSVAGSKKFMAKQLGPFEIIERVGRLAYKLLLPASMSRVHPVFHVSLLKRPRDGGRKTAPPPAMLLDGAEECEIYQVLNHRAKPHKRQPNHREYYVSWRGMGPEENEWLSENKLKNNSDAVQNYLNGLQSKTRQAPRLGKPATESPEYADTPGRPAVTPSESSSKKKKKRGRPAKRSVVPLTEQRSVAESQRRSNRVRTQH